MLVVAISNHEECLSVREIQLSASFVCMTDEFPALHVAVVSSGLFVALSAEPNRLWSNIVQPGLILTFEEGKRSITSRRLFHAEGFQSS
jgi:hypothetical protein